MMSCVARLRWEINDFDFFRGIDYLSEHIIYMAVTEFGGELKFIHVCYAEYIAVLRPQVGIPFLISVFIQLKLKRVKILINRPVNPPAIAETPLLHGFLLNVMLALGKKST